VAAAPASGLPPVALLRAEMAAAVLLLAAATQSRLPAAAAAAVMRAEEVHAAAVRPLRPTAAALADGSPWVAPAQRVTAAALQTPLRA
jgi:hypothetical protein